MTKQIIQLAPYFPPDIDGLGEFASHLGDALMKTSGVESEFIIWKAPKDISSEQFHNFQYVQRLNEQGRDSLTQALNTRLRQSLNPTLLLHYTSYSYSKEGLPWWLPGVLNGFKVQGGRVVTFFHELYAKGHFPNKTWMGSWLQKRIFRQILRLSDAAITSNEDYFRTISEFNQSNCPLLLAAIGSNVGELSAPKPLTERSRRLIIFGLWVTRLRLYERHLDGIKELADRLQIDEIADIGNIDQPAPMLKRAKTELGDRMKIYGRLPAKEISTLLADSLIGSANYNYALRSKSGVVAAYQAHGLPCLLFPPLDEVSTGPLSEECLSFAQFCSTPQQDLPGLLTKSSIAGFADYQANRSFDSIANKIKPLLGS